MLNIYAIDMKPTHVHNIKQIPRDALTHYAYNIHPVKTTAPKTLNKKAKSHLTQRKVMKKSTHDAMPAEKALFIPLIQLEIIIGVPYDMYPAGGDRRAQNEYYYKNAKSPAQIAQEERAEKAAAARAQQAKQFADMAAELDAEDRARAEHKYRETIAGRYELIPLKPIDYKTAIPYEIAEQNTINNMIITMSEERFNSVLNPTKPAKTDITDDSSVWDEYDHDFDTDEFENWKATVIERIIVPAPVKDMNKDDDYIKERFVKKYQGAETSAAMRALDKINKYKNQKNMLRKLQNTK